METVLFAFYKPQKGDFFGNIIANYTWFFNWVGSGFKKQEKYEHVEIGFNKQIVKDTLIRCPELLTERLQEVLNNSKQFIYYSSASRNADGSNGTRWIADIDLLKYPERWEIIEAKCTRPYADMLATCVKELRKPYDWSGIFGFVTLFGQVNEKEKWYCSEICYFIFFGKWVKRVSPIAFFNKIFMYIIKL